MSAPKSCPWLRLSVAAVLVLPSSGFAPPSTATTKQRARPRVHGAEFDGLPLGGFAFDWGKLFEASGGSAPPSLPAFSLPTASIPQVPGPLAETAAAAGHLGAEAWAGAAAVLMSAVPESPAAQAALQAFAQEVGELTSRVDPAAQPLLLAPLAVVAAAALGDAWDKVGGDSSAGGAAPYSGGTDSYNEAEAKEFYGARPLLVLKRLASLAQLTGGFNAKLLLDFLRTPKEAESWVNEKERAREALVLANLLGPTFIKLGQAASIRTDLIPENYALELRQLQDAVPPFDDDEAYAVLRRELGVADLGEVFSSLSESPVASASIGQVYRGTLKGSGRDVAVKVQRPSVLADIALDLFILRLLTPIQVRVSNAINKLTTDPGDLETALALVDEWGRGFVAEVDYLLEAKNTEEFKEAMARRGLNAVTAPTVVKELSTSKVLVTEWVEGTRLDRDASPDVPRLCGVAVNAYLTMLLDTGTLHCDPHPGNLLRTTDGRLCVLDWGMTLQVPPDLQYALLEFIAHVNSEDYEAIPGDFVNLGFTPPDQLEKVQNSGLTEGLTFALRQLSQGGGANKMRERLKAEFQSRYGEGLSDEEIRAAARAEMLQQMEAQLAAEGVDVNGVTNIMEEMSRRNRELFKLPPYVLYVSRAFSTLEGIGLSLDEDYSILMECYPYLAKRLLTDNSPRARTALRAMLYGPQATPAHIAMDAAPASPPQTAPKTGSQTRSQTGAAFAAAGVAAAAPAAAAGGGLLSPDKVLEMTQGFTSFTAATADADSSGRGMAEARAAFAELLLADFTPVDGLAGSLGEDGGGEFAPNLIQEVLATEAARLVDSALVSALASAPEGLAGLLGRQVTTAAAPSAESAPAAASAAAPSGASAWDLAAGRLLERLDATVPASLRPLAGPLLLPITAPLRLSSAVGTAARAALPLVTPTAEDEKVLAIARALAQAANPNDRDAAGANPAAHNGAAAGPSAGAGQADASVEALLRAVADLAQDEQLASVVRAKGPGAAARLSKLFAAALLDRAAARLDAATAAEIASGAIDAGGSVAEARRSARAAVLEPLRSALK